MTLVTFSHATTEGGDTLQSYSLQWDKHSKWQIVVTQEGHAEPLSVKQLGARTPDYAFDTYRTICRKAMYLEHNACMIAHKDYSYTVSYTDSFAHSFGKQYKLFS